MHSAHYEKLCYYVFGWERFPFTKGGVPMQYVTYQDLIQIGILIVAVIGLFHEINKK